MRKIIRLGAAFVLSISTLLTVGFAGVAYAGTGTYYEWTGASSSTAGSAGCTSNCWSVAGNWNVSTDGGSTYTTATSAPSSADNSNLGDNLVFDVTNLSVNTITTNDISGLNVDSLTFQGTSSSGYEYTLAGAGINLASGINDTGTYPEIDLNLTLTASQTFTSTGGINLGSNSSTPVLSIGSYTLTLAVDGQLWDYGTVTGSGPINLQGSTGPSSSGGIVLYSANPGFTGNFTASADSAVETVPGGLGSGNVVLGNNAQLVLDGFNGQELMNNLTLGGSDAIYTDDAGGGYSQSSSVDSTQNVTIGGTLTLTADTTVATGGVVVISGPISGDYTLAFDDTIQPEGQLVIDSSNNQSATPNTTSSGSSSGSSSAGGSATTVPKTPDTGSSLISSDIELPLIGATLVAGGLYIAGKKNINITIRQK